MSKVASSTKNIYGVYDMSGGISEYVMSNIVDIKGISMMSGKLSNKNSGYTGIIYDSGNYTLYTGISYPDNKYYDKYSFNKEPTKLSISKLGDGIKEVYRNIDGEENIENPVYDSPWSVRSGIVWFYPTVNIFVSSYDFGSAESYLSSRIVIVP